MKYFTINELIRSDTALQRGIDNTPPPPIKIKLSNLINNLLDPIREAWGSPISVNSGYRCPVLNRAVGGVPTSQHQKGEAADITVGSPEQNRKLFDLIAAGCFDFDQLIDESNYSWVHISYAAGKNRHAILHL